MLELYSSHRYASRQSRRKFLQAGTLGFSGLTLAQLLRAEAAAGIKSSRKSVINIHLDGGPPQMDMIDMKPDSPSEVCGEFKPIPTVLPGFQICELMPKTAQTGRPVHRAVMGRHASGGDPQQVLSIIHAVHRGNRQFLR